MAAVAKCFQALYFQKSLALVAVNLSLVDSLALAAELTVIRKNLTQTSGNP